MSATAPPALASRAAVMAQAGAENFPVAMRLLGRDTATHLLAVYGFARLVDDTGDELAGDRLAALDAIECDLARIYAGRAPEHAVLAALAPSVRACGLPRQALVRLIEANRLDQVKARYATYAELLDYCQLSAAPVGELVLHVFGVTSPVRLALSDRVCAALQVIEHIQDIAEDHARGRIYLPAADLSAAGVAETDLAAPSASPALRAVIALQVRRCHGLLAAGPPLLRGLGPRPRLAIAGFLAGGRATLRAIESVQGDVLAHRPRRSATGFARAFTQVVRGR
jgi:squalene synthase HpnC